MSVTITRTAWTDDDGSGTTGTVINNAVKTSLYDQIDTALASLLPLTGGTMTGDLLFTDATYDVGKSGATRPRDGFFSRNLTVGGTLAVTGVATLSASTIGLRGVTYTLPSADGSSGQFLSTNGSATLSWATSSIPNPIAVDLLFTDATYDIGKSGATRPRDGFFSRNLAVGGIYYGGTTLSGGDGAYFNIIGTLGAVAQAMFKPTSNATGGIYILFENAAGSNIGSITELAGSASIAFNTTSDARLKDDRGLATSVQVLRDTRIHEFAWKANGHPGLGVFAQEAVDVNPRAVTVGDEDDLEKHPWQVDYSKYVPDLIVGWQNHDARLAALESRQTVH